MNLLLLASVREGPRHGYAIIETLRERSGGTFDLAEGTVYPALHRLERQGLLSGRWARKSGRRRRVYELTKAGARELSEQRQSWDRFAHGVNVVLEGSS